MPVPAFQVTAIFGSSLEVMVSVHGEDPNVSDVLCSGWSAATVHQPLPKALPSASVLLEKSIHQARHAGLLGRAGQDWGRAKI